MPERAPRLIAPLLALLVFALGAPLTPSRADAPSALDAPIDELDPLALARLVDRMGDGAIIAALGDASASPVARLRLVRAARFLDAPEAALLPLAELAAGRDPRLAPAAALAAYRIASALTLPGLEARETTPAELEPSRRALAALGADETARGDLRRLGLFAAAALGALAPAPAEPE